MNTAPKRERQQDGISENYLMDYLEGNLSTEAQHRLEDLMDQDPFLRDAVEGLSEMTDKSRITAIALQLNTQLKNQTRSRRNRRIPFIHQKLLIWVAALIIVLFIFLAWWFFRIAFPG
jgi:ferric-dicitrate binding protein FerR (iron transport regulator)